MKVVGRNDLTGRFITAVGAYLSACLVSALFLSALQGKAFDSEMIGFAFSAVFIAALIPFALTKSVMILFSWDDAAAHSVIGAIAAISALVLFGRPSMLTPVAIISFLILGSIAGLVYWGARSVGRRLFKGTTE